MWGFLGVNCFYVPSKSAILTESFFTQGTYIRMFPSVDSVVFGPVISKREGFFGPVVSKREGFCTGCAGIESSL